MPQLMPLNWWFSLFMLVFLVIVVSILYNSVNNLLNDNCDKGMMISEVTWKW